jgi:DNA primase
MVDNKGLQRDVFEIARNVPLKSVIMMCGIEIDYNGKFLCPFHDDHNPSGQIYTNQRGQERWHCFPCGIDGSGIDFVMRRYGMEPLAAATKIAEHFGWTPPQPGLQSGKIRLRKPIRLRQPRRTTNDK